MRRWTSVLLAVFLVMLAVTPVLAHQPFFEDEDATPEKPFSVKDPTISTAVYATLDSRRDVDYFAFDGRRGQRILLSIVIPQIPGQERFAPEMALMGPGLPPADLPPHVTKPVGAGVYPLPALAGPARSFYEPFGRRSYWERQEERVTLPADGRYVVAIWHATGEVGRYTFVIGDREIPGGDPAAARKTVAYWTPVPTPAPEPATKAGAATAPYSKMSGCGAEFLSW